MSIRLEHRDVSRNGVTTAIVDAFAGGSDRAFFTGRVTADLEASRRKFAKAVAQKHLGADADEAVVKSLIEHIDNQLLRLASMPLDEPDPEPIKEKPATRFPDIDDDAFVLNPKDPLPIARRFRETFYTHRDGPTLWCDGVTFYGWDGTKYAERKEPAIRSELYPWLETAQKLVKRGDMLELAPFQPTSTIVNHIIDALNAESFLDRRPPCWISGDGRLPNPLEVVAASNGLVHLQRNAIANLFGPPTPLFFSPNALDYPFNANAPEPAEWIRFLDQLWPDDREAIECLQEWFGYCLTPVTRLQKALLLVGPKRGGKGTIARVLSRMIGTANVCGPTLSGLSTNFGLWALIGKLLAVISDARLSGRTDQAIITERILAITGEDAITIDRKNLEPLTVRLPTRLMILTNELPRLNDASGALASRFLVLTLTESFFGREDTGLEDRICAELPGILLWAIAGWQRLQQRGHFVQPTSAKEAIDELNDLASPISAFVREWCNVRAGLEIPVAELFEAWGFWCREQGNGHPGTQAVFGRDLRAAVSGMATQQRGSGDTRYRAFQGIDLKEVAKAVVAQERAKLRETDTGRHA